MDKTVTSSKDEGNTEAARARRGDEWGGEVGTKGRDWGLSPEALWEEQFQALGSDWIAPPRQEQTWWLHGGQ